MKSLLAVLLIFFVQNQVVFGEEIEKKNKELGGTDKCNADEVSEVGQDIDQCTTDAARRLSDNFSFRHVVNEGFSNIWKHRCELLAEENACADKYGLKCLSPRGLEGLKLQTVSNEKERALENPEVLGLLYILTCDDLRNYESNWIMHQFGTTKCSYTMGKRLIKEKKSCEERVIAYRKILLSTTGIKINADDVKLITCNYKNALIDCVQPIRDCMSADMKMEQDEEMENVTRILETKLREDLGLIIPAMRDFSFEKDCPVLNEEPPEPVNDTDIDENQETTTMPDEITTTIPVAKDPVARRMSRAMKSSDSTYLSQESLLSVYNALVSFEEDLNRIY